EVHFPELQVEIVCEQTLNHRPHSLRIHARLQEVEIDDVLTEPVNVTRDHVEERVDHLRLQLRTDASDHAEVEESKMPAVHHQQIAGMRIGVKETVLQQLLEVRADQHAIDFDRRDAIGAQSFEIDYLRTANKVEREHARVRV